MAEFQVSFDQDLHLLEFQDCPGVPSGPCPPVNVSECPPCDYASKSTCGTIREARNRTDQACIDKCARDPEWCDPTTTFGPWEEINIGDTIVGRGPSFGSNPPFITYRLYVPEGHFCNFSIFIRQTLGSVMLHAGDLLISRTPLNATEAFLTNSRMPWLGAGADVLNSDNIHVCPTDFSPVPGFYTDEAGAGTYFIILIGPQVFNLSVTKLPIAPPLPDEDMSWCDSSTLPEPFNVPASIFAPAPGSLVPDIFTDGEIHCIANDRLYEFFIPSGQLATLVVLLARVEGPCPRMFGITQTDDNSAAFSEIYASTVTAYPSFGDLNDLGEPAILMDHDFAKRSLVWSFCPNDTTTPTYIAISIWSGGPQRIFYSTNPARFRATRFDDVGSPQELAYVAASAMTLKFPGGGYSPDCSLRCVYSGSPCSCAFAVGPMSPFTDPSPLWPYPRWYINTIGRGNLAQSFTPDYVRALTFNGTRSMYMSVQMSSTSFLENSTATKTYFSEADVAQAYVGFYGQFSVVNVNFEAPMPDFLSSFVPAPYKRVSLPCTNELYSAARASVDKVLPRLLNVSTDLSSTNIELDVLNFVDGFVGCIQKADALLVERNVTRLASTTGCLATDFFSQTLLPCCSPEADWAECCLPTLANVTDVSYSLPPPDSLLSQCQDPACLNTYLSDYLLQRETSCATALPRSAAFALSSCHEPHVVCERAVYGANLAGVPCVTDADCGSNGFCSEPALPGISQGDPYETFSRPRGVRRTCRVPRDNLTEAYLNCLVEIRSPAVIQMLDAKYPAPTYEQSVRLLLADPLYRIDACVAPAGIAPEPGMGTYWKRGNVPIGSICPQGFDQWSILPERSYSIVPDYWRRGPDDYCKVFPDWFRVYTDQTTCEGRLTCNWLDCVSKNLGDSACQTACLAPTGVCAICRSDGTCFDDFATIDASATDNVTCAASQACQLANGSIVALDAAACAQTFSCSHPCWNAVTQAYEACAGEAECIGAGECDDELFHNPFTGEDSSCVIGMSNRASYYTQNCALMVDRQFGVNNVVGDPTGCVIWDALDEQECASLDGASVLLVNPVWHTRARTRVECEGACGCVKDSTWHPSPDRPNITDTWPATPAECAACTPAQECSPYHTWTQARWERGNPRTLRWVDAPAMVPAYTWATDVMEVAQLKNIIDEYCEVSGVTYRNRALTAADCRFGRAAAALQAVACGCDTNASSDPSGACYQSIGSTARIGIAVACPLVAATLTVPPHTIAFAEESVPLAVRCQNLEFYASPLALYRSSAPAQRLSTYFSPKSQTRSRQEFEFLNRHDAVVGEVIAEGITLRSNATFYNVTFCLSLGSFEASLPNFDLSRFDFLDLALSPDPSTVVPLEVATSIRNGGYCGRVSEVPPNATVVAILRMENWRDARKPGLTRGEKTVLALVAAAYFICAIAYGPYYCLSFVRVNGWRLAVTVSFFWLPILLGISNILRGIYFALLGSGVLANSTYVDVLLVELPTFIWFTATLLMVLFWIVLLASIWDQSARIRRLKRAFWITFIIANVVMYALFIAFVVVFSQLDETVEKTKCSGRLQSEIVRRPKRIAFIVYQSFLAGVTILLALAYLVGGLLLGRKLRLVRVDEANRKNTKQIWRLVLVACVVSVAVAMHALFIFLLAITQPGIPYLALVLLALDVVPSAVLLWSLPAPTTEVSTSSGSRASGLQSRQSVVSDL